MNPAWERASAILLVNAAEPAEERLVVQFHDGRCACLEPRNRRWDDLRRMIADSCRRQVPVGLWLDDQGGIQDAGWAQRDFLLNMTDDPAHLEWVWVWFATSGSYPLRRDHPGFPRIAEVIQRYKQSDWPAWFVIGSGQEGVELLDVQVLQREEDALLCRQSNLGWA